MASLVADALELASLSEPDELAAPPDPTELTRALPDLDLFDPARALGGHSAGTAVLLPDSGHNSYTSNHPMLLQKARVFSTSASGIDVIKALAMGARAVFIGRPALWGLAYNVSMMVYSEN